MSDDSSSDDCMYSGQAQRYGRAKQASLAELRLRRAPAAPAASAFDAASSDDSFDAGLPSKRPRSDDDADDADRNEKPRKQVETIDDLDDDAVVVAAAAAAPCVGRDGDTSVVVVEDDIVEVGERSLLTDRADSEPEDEPVRTQIVKVRFRSKILRVELAADEYFRTLAQQVAAGADESHPRVRLFLNDRPLDPYDTLKTVPVAITDFIEAYVASEEAAAEGVAAPPAPTDADVVQLKVQAQSRSSSVTVSLRRHDPMQVLMDKYAEQTGQDAAKLSFHFDGEPLPPSQTPDSLELEGGECIDVHVK